MMSRHSSIDELLKKELDRSENEKTRLIIEDLSNVKKKGYFTKDEFLRMCM